MAGSPESHATLRKGSKSMLRTLRSNWQSSPAKGIALVAGGSGWSAPSALQPILPSMLRRPRACNASLDAEESWVAVKDKLSYYDPETILLTLYLYLYLYLYIYIYVSLSLSLPLTVL